MFDNFDTTSLMAVAAVLGFASGIRLYAVLFLVGLAGHLGWVPLPHGLQVLQHPLMLTASGFMLLVEFFADKVPALDTVWDAIHTLIRIPAGAALAAGVFGADNGTLAAAAALLGGSLAATSHFTKAGGRALINTSPEPVSNAVASTSEDVLVVALLSLAAAHPLVAAAVVAVLVVVAIWLLPRIIGMILSMLRRAGAILFGRGGGAGNRSDRGERRAPAPTFDGLDPGRK
ncbi:MAG TPA: DUF4126 domain-containing protein [Burkholderiaceae bacterium]|nr:DUF4126 domain-containing protein [Burkholderiaceae bacterium]